MSMIKTESIQHRELKLELVNFLEDQGWRIDAIDGENGKSTQEVENSSDIGDGENKRPDIDAFDEKDERMIRGEAKTGDGDLNSQHSITQYKLFSSRERNGIPSWLYIIIPSEHKSELERILDENLTDSQRKKVGIKTS